MACFPASCKSKDNGTPTISLLPLNRPSHQARVLNLTLVIFFRTVVRCLVLTQFPQSVAVQNTALDWLLPTKNEITPNIDFIPIQFSHAPWDVFWVYSCPDSFIPTLGQPLECFQIWVQFSYLLLVYIMTKRHIYKNNQQCIDTHIYNQRCCKQIWVMTEIIGRFYNGKLWLFWAGRGVGLIFKMLPNCPGTMT